MTYRVLLSHVARRDLRRIRGKEKSRIMASIDNLAKDPRPRGFKKLRGATDLFRIRAGNYRIVYSIKDERLIVLVIRVGRRDDIYDKDL